MTVNELKAAVDKAIKEGHGEVEVMFDSEARTFHVHLVEIDSADVIDKTVTGYSTRFVLTTRYH